MYVCGRVLCMPVRKSVYLPACVRVCARATGRERERERERERGGCEKSPDRCVSGSLCVDLGRRLLYITFKADNIIAWPDK